MERINKEMEEWKAKKSHDPKPKPEPKPHTELPQGEKDRIEEAVKSWFNFQMAPCHDVRMTGVTLDLGRLHMRRKCGICRCC